MTKRRQKQKPIQDAQRSSRYEFAWLAVIILAHIIFGAIYIAHTPFGTAPDEGVHAKYVQELVDNRAFLVFDPVHLNNYEAHQPPLYYVLGVPFYLVGKALGMLDPGWAVRFLSLLIGAFCVVFIYLAVKSAFPEEKILPLTCAGFAALLPTHAMLSSSVSNDILTELVFILFLYAAARIMVTGPTWKLTGALGLILGIGLLTKTTCIVLFPVAALVYALVWQRKALNTKSALEHMGIAFLISLVIGGWWCVRNQMLYGDPFAMSQFEKAFQFTAKPDYWFQRGWTPGPYLVLVTTWTFCSFWGVFGHMQVWMPIWIYAGAGIITILAVIRAIPGFLGLRNSNSTNRDILLVYAAVFALVLLTFVKFNMVFFQAQGRYFYPALVPIALCWTVGISRLLPAKIRHLTPYVAVGIPFVAQILAVMTRIIPVMPYYHI